MRGFVLVIGIIFCLGVATPLAAQQYSLRQYTVVDGLPQSQVNAIVEDQHGYLWLGTNGGLARFDGREFKVYTTLDGLLSNFVTSLMIDSHQNLWIVHPRGITRFDGVSYKKFQPPPHTPEMRRIRRIIELQDSVVVISGSGLIGKIYGDSVYYWSRPLMENKIVFFAHTSPRKEAVFYLNDSSFLMIQPSGLRIKISHKKQFAKVYNILNYRKEILIDTDSGFFAINAAQKKFVHRSLVSPNHIIAFDSLHRTTWSRKENAFLRESLEGTAKKIDTVFRDMRVAQILFDQEGNTWLATDGNGLYKYFMQDFSRCGSEKLKDIMAIEKDASGATWLGSSSKGLWRIRKGKVKSFASGDDSGSAILDIKKSPQGVLWVASFGGLGRFNPERDAFEWYRRQEGLSSQYVTNLDFDERGGIWCGTSGGGVNYFDGKNFSSFSIKEGLLSRNASAIKYFTKYKTLYVGSELGLNEIRDGAIHEIPLPDLATAAIISIHVYHDSLLMIGTTGAGIFFLDPKSKIQKQLTTRDGLLSNYIYFAAEDDDNRVWVGTEKGISRIKLSRQLEIVEDINYGYENGLTGLETNQNAFYLGKEKYFGLVDGVYQYNDFTNLSFKAYDLHLTGVEVFYGEFSSRDFANHTFGFFKIPERPSFPSDKNHITFRFNRVDKRYPKSVAYKYFLENFDKKWSPPTSVGQVTYSNLPPGNYVLKIVATTPRGSWDITPLSYPFVIDVPFYKTASFLIGLIVAALIVIVLYSYAQVKRRVGKMLEVERIRQQEQDSLRKEIARDFHDEMGNQLTRIINYISLMKMSANGHASEYYNKVEDSAKYLYTGTRDFIWSIDPGNDELSQVFIHIRDFGEKLFEEKNIQFRAFNEIREKLKIPYGVSRELNLIMKEAMTNAFNHSQAKNVSFTLRQEDGKCEMRLEDDGIGFDRENLAKVNGLKNMISRAERMYASLDIQAQPKKGTRISLYFRYTQTNTPWLRQKKEF
jgi:ligand-binding sensor domain-containing protein/signal transduction histidine kinase